MNAPEPSTVEALIRELATALMELAVAVNRQTQAVEAGVEQMRQFVQSAAASPAPDEREDDDHLPTHDLGGQPIKIR